MSAGKTVQDEDALEEAMERPGTMLNTQSHRPIAGAVDCPGRAGWAGNLGKAWRKPGEQLGKLKWERCASSE